MTDKTNGKKESKKTKTSWEPKKTVMRVAFDKQGTQWKPERSVMKTLKEGYKPRKSKKTES